MRRDHWISVAGFVGLAALLVGTFWIVPYLPTNDGPEGILAAHIENHYGDPGTIYAEHFVPALAFAGRGFTLLYAPLEAWLGWQRGLQVVLGIMVVALAGGFAALVLALDRRRWALAFLGFPLALSWPFYMGFWAFVVASGLGLFVLALAVRGREPTWRARALLALLLLLQAVAHIFAAVLTGSVIATLFLVRSHRGRRLAEIGKTSLMGLPAASVLLAALLTSDDSTRALQRTFSRMPWRQVVAVLPQTLAPGPFVRALFMTLAVLAAAAAAGLRARQASADPSDRGLGLCAIGFLLAGILAPIHIPGWQYFSPRFLPIGCALAFAVIPLEQLPPPAQRFAAPGLFLVSALWLGLSYPFHERLAASCADAIAGLFAPIHRTATQLPVVLARVESADSFRELEEVPHVEPLLHMGALYATAQGGLVPYSFAYSAAAYPLRMRAVSTQGLPVPNMDRYYPAIQSDRFQRSDGYRHEVENELASMGMPYEGVIVLGARPGDIALWHERGYVADWEHGSTLLAHFEPCSVDFTIPRAAADPGPVFDLYASKFRVLSNARVPFRVSSDGLAHFELPTAPCGDVGIKARWEPSDGTPPAFCRNADTQGTVHANITRTSRAVRCDGPAPTPAVVAP